MRRIFVDTGVWYAYLDSCDPDHSAVSEELRAWKGRLTTSNFVIDETLTLIRYRLGWKPAHAFGKIIFNGGLAKHIRISAADENDAWGIFSRYSDKTFSFTDCTSFAVMERLKIDCALAIDSDFHSYGLHCLPAGQ